MSEPWHVTALRHLKSQEWDDEWCKADDEESYWLWLVKKLESLNSAQTKDQP